VAYNFVNIEPILIVIISVCLSSGYYHIITASKHHLGGHKFKVDREVETSGTARLKCDGARAETRFGLSAKRTSPFTSAGASVQSTAGSRGVRISGSNGSNARYTMF